MIRAVTPASRGNFSVRRIKEEKPRSRADAMCIVRVRAESFRLPDARHDADFCALRCVGRAICVRLVQGGAVSGFLAMIDL